MELKGKLRDEFEKWSREHFNIQVLSGIYLHEYLDSFPMSMQLSLLCEFLESKSYLTGNAVGELLQGGYMVKFWNGSFKGMSKHTGETKEEAINKAIEYLNENY